MHILQSFCIAMFLSLFIHNKTPKVFCLTFGVHVAGQLLHEDIFSRITSFRPFRRPQALQELAQEFQRSRTL